MNRRERRIYIKTFDGFDVYVDGKIVYFPSGKAKEMLAVMVEKKGSSVSLAQMSYLLYENSEEARARNTLRVVYHRLRKTLEEYEIEDVVIKRRGSYAVDTDRFECDFYEFMKGRSSYSNAYSGVYMPEYPWARNMLPYLDNLYRRNSGQRGKEQRDGIH